MVFYNVFVAFVGLNNNTILAMQNTEFRSISSDRYPDPAENISIEALPILNIGSANPYYLLLPLFAFLCHILYFDAAKFSIKHIEKVFIDIFYCFCCQTTG